MNLKNHFSRQKPWIRGGAIGVLICTALFPFYSSIYFPFVDSQGWHSDSVLIMPTISGHALPIFTHFIVEGSSISTNLCLKTETHCSNWASEDSEGQGIPLGDPPGSKGYCMKQEISPKSSCLNRIEDFTIFISIAFLEGVYFAIGAIMAIIFDKRKKP